MIPVIDFNSESALDEIRKAYTTVGFAVFTNCLSDVDQEIMNLWFKKMKEFFELPLETKKKYSYEYLHDITTAFQSNLGIQTCKQHFARVVFA